MNSTRSFMGLWLGLTVIILGYAAIDLWMHPWLGQETHFSMTPDLTQIGDLWHWGGRLLKEDAVVLLIANAVIVAGAIAMGFSAVMRIGRRLRRTVGRMVEPMDSPSPVSERIFSATPSVPPPSM